MSTPRITQRSITTTALQGLQHNQAKLHRIQEQLSSGRQVNRPSDAPVQTVEAMHLRSELRRTEQHLRNAGDGLARLETADSALTSSLDLVRRARDLTLVGMNGSTDAGARQALAAEVETLREGLLGIANARYLGSPVFGGTTAGRDAYATPGGSYVGDQGTVARTVAAGTQVEVDVSGPQAFGRDGSGTQLFEVLGGLVDALRGSPTPSGGVADLEDGLGKLDTALDRIVTTLGSIGARQNRIETMRLRAEDQQVRLTDGLAEVESIDLPRTIVDLQMQEVAYQAALGATARVVQPSLLDFLR